MKRALLVIAVLAEFTALAKAAPVPLVVGEPFVVARARLYRLGWRPDMKAHAWGDYSALERELVQSGYPEVDSCSLGKSFCNLQYTKGNSCLRLQTQGEQIRWMKVETWTDECRQPEKDEPVDLLPSDVRLLVQRVRECDESGSCEGGEAYLKALKRKYLHNLSILKVLNGYEFPVEVSARAKK